MKKFFTLILCITILFCFSCNKKQEQKTQPQKLVYLTFDDGPCNNTLKILEILKKYDIKATFFVVGTMVEKHTDILRKIYNLGHSIGLHSYSHIYKKIYSSDKELKLDVISCLNAVKKVIPDFSEAIYRFPGGSFNLSNNTKQLVKDLGFTYYDWNASTLDAEGNFTPYEIFKNTINTSTNKNKIILLAHDTKPNVTLALEDIIRYYLENGYTFKKL